MSQAKPAPSAAELEAVRLQFLDELKAAERAVAKMASTIGSFFGADKLLDGDREFLTSIHNQICERAEASGIPTMGPPLVLMIGGILFSSSVQPLIQALTEMDPLDDDDKAAIAEAQAAIHKELSELL